MTAAVLSSDRRDTWLRELNVIPLQWWRRCRCSSCEEVCEEIFKKVSYRAPFSLLWIIWTRQVKGVELAFIDEWGTPSPEAVHP